MDFDAHQPSWFFQGDNQPGAIAALQDYATNYTGAWFDRLADVDHPNQITAQDIVAVSTLGVDIPANKSIWILGPGSEAITALLTQIPQHQAIWHPDANLESTGPAWKLWNLIKSTDNSWPPGHGGVATTKLSKLLAAKRPDLIPIHDALIDQALFDAKIANYWAPWTRLHRSPQGQQLRDLATSARDNADIGEYLGPLRIIDIVIWYWARHHLATNHNDTSEQ